MSMQQKRNYSGQRNVENLLFHKLFCSYALTSNISAEKNLPMGYADLLKKIKGIILYMLKDVNATSRFENKFNFKDFVFLKFFIH